MDLDGGRRYRSAGRALPGGGMELVAQPSLRDRASRLARRRALRRRVADFLTHWVSVSGNAATPGTNTSLVPRCRGVPASVVRLSCARRTYVRMLGIVMTL